MLWPVTASSVASARVGGHYCSRLYADRKMYSYPIWNWKLSGFFFACFLAQVRLSQSMRSEMTPMSFSAVKQGIQWNPKDAHSLEEDMTGMGAETECWKSTESLFALKVNTWVT